MLIAPSKFSTAMSFELDFTSKILPTILHASFKFLLSRIIIDFSVHMQYYPSPILEMSLTSSGTLTHSLTIPLLVFITAVILCPANFKATSLSLIGQMSSTIAPSIS